MEIVLALVIGALYSIGIYMVLRRSIVKLVIGFILLSHASNLLIFTVGRLKKGEAPIIPEDAEAITHTVADPVPQALILTAIVISFGLTAFTLVLVKRVYQSVATNDVDKLTLTDDINEMR